MPNDDQRSTPSLVIRVSPRELARVREAARAAGEPRYSTWARTVLLHLCDDLLGPVTLAESTGHQ